MSSPHRHSEPTRPRDAIHLPGGQVRPEHWTALASLAAGHGSEIELTARGAVRIPRPDGGAVTASEFVDGGLPAAVGDPRSRDILASPLAGRLEGRHDLGDLPGSLASALAESAHTPGTADRDDDLVFGFDDGSGDVLAHGPDLTAAVDTATGGMCVHITGRDTGVVVSRQDVVRVLVDVAAGFATADTESTRVPTSGRLHDHVVVVVHNHHLTSPVATPTDAGSTTTVKVPRVGWVDTADGLVSLLAVVPHSRVPARLAEFLGAVERPGTISADGVIGLHELTEHMAEQVVRVLAPMGLVFDAASPWAQP